MNNHRRISRQVAAIVLLLTTLNTYVNAGDDSETGPVVQRAGNVVVERDVTYGRADDRVLQLDIIRPAERPEKPLPVIVYIHGGGWRAGDKSWGYAFLHPFAESGDYFTASINYRLAPEAVWPAPIHDCKAAIRWLRSNSRRLNIDPDRIGVWGASAGAHLANVIATSGYTTNLEGDCGSPNVSSSVACAVSFSGPSDFVEHAKNGAIKIGPGGVDPVARLLGGPVAQNMNLAKQASPITYVSKDSPPFLIMHGTKDEIVALNQAERLHAALRKANVESTFVTIIDGAHNFGCPDVVQRVATFFDKHLRSLDVEVAETAIKQPRSTVAGMLAKLAGKWQQDVNTVCWRWTLDTPCLTGALASAAGTELGTMMMGFSPSTNGVTSQEFYLFGNRRIDFTSLSDTQWKGVSELTYNNGSVETATVVLEWNGADKFLMRYTDQKLNGAMPKKDSIQEFNRIADKPAAQIPSTISLEAQKVLRDAGSLPAFLRERGGVVKRRTVEQCEELQRDFEENWKKASEATRLECKAKIKFKTMNGVKVCEITPDSYREDRDPFVLIWIHGGGFVLGSAESAWGGGVRVATYSGVKVISIGYRLAPQHRYPAGLDDCLAVYRELSAKHDPSTIGVFGGSAGGNLAVSLVLKARDEGLQLPGAVAAISPWSDLTKPGDTYDTLIGKDPVLHSYEATEWCVHAYVKEAELTHPLVSPVYADYGKGFPPTLIQTGTRDLFLSNCARLYRKMKNERVDVELSVWEGMWHGFNDEHFREAKDASREIAAFFLQQLKLAPIQVRNRTDGFRTERKSRKRIEQ